MYATLQVYNDFVRHDPSWFNLKELGVNRNRFCKGPGSWEALTVAETLRPASDLKL